MSFVTVWPFCIQINKNAILGEAPEMTAETSIGQFTAVYSVTWPLNGSEAGGDLVLIKTSLFLL